VRPAARGSLDNRALTRRSVSASARLADFSVRCRTGRSARAATLVAGQLHVRTSVGISDDRVARRGVNLCARMIRTVAVAVASTSPVSSRSSPARNAMDPPRWTTRPVPVIRPGSGRTQEADLQLQGRRELAIAQGGSECGAERVVEHGSQKPALHVAHRIGEGRAGIEEDLDLAPFGSYPGQLPAQRRGGRRGRRPPGQKPLERPGPADHRRIAHASSLAHVTDNPGRHTTGQHTRYSRNEARTRFPPSHRRPHVR
jgi:hypothetical protein